MGQCARSFVALHLIALYINKKAINSNCSLFFQRYDLDDVLAVESKDLNNHAMAIQNVLAMKNAVNRSAQHQHQ